MDIKDEWAEWCLSDKFGHSKKQRRVLRQELNKLADRPIAHAQPRDDFPNTRFITRRAADLHRCVASTFKPNPALPSVSAAMSAVLNDAEIKVFRRHIEKQITDPSLRRPLATAVMSAKSSELEE